MIAARGRPGDSARLRSRTPGSSTRAGGEPVHSLTPLPLRAERDPRPRPASTRTGTASPHVLDPRSRPLEQLASTPHGVESPPPDSIKTFRSRPLAAREASSGRADPWIRGVPTRCGGDGRDPRPFAQPDAARCPEVPGPTPGRPPLPAHGRCEVGRAEVPKHPERTAAPPPCPSAGVVGVEIRDDLIGLVEPLARVGIQQVRHAHRSEPRNEGFPLRTPVSDVM